MYSPSTEEAQERTNLLRLEYCIGANSDEPRCAVDVAVDEFLAVMDIDADETCNSMVKFELGQSDT